MLIFCLVGIIAACLTIFLNYCLGKPGSENFSPYEIFSRYTLWLSARRLKQIDLIKTYHSQYQENINRATFKHELLQIQKDYQKMIYEVADPFFTWERAVGMCSVCTGFWISLFTGLAYMGRYSSKNFWSLDNFFNLLIIIVISHVTIRLLTKIL